MKSTIQQIELDCPTAFMLKNGYRVSGFMSEWDWDGDVVTLYRKNSNDQVVQWVEVLIPEIVITEWWHE